MLTSYSHHFTLSSLLLYIEKALICLKTRNGIVFSPHPRTKKSTAYTAKLVLDAAVAAGAPKDIIGWISKPTLPLSQALMHHPKIDLILATGGPSMVKAAYSSAKPAIGVGAGNTPVVVDETADVKRVVSSILMSKTLIPFSMACSGAIGQAALNLPYLHPPKLTLKQVLSTQS